MIEEIVKHYQEQGHYVFRAEYSERAEPSIAGYPMKVYTEFSITLLLGGNEAVDVADKMAEEFQLDGKTWVRDACTLSQALTGVELFISYRSSSGKPRKGPQRAKKHGPLAERL